VILLDVIAAASTGIETPARIRALDQRVPVVMLSVVGKASTIVEAMQLGAGRLPEQAVRGGAPARALEKGPRARSLERERDRLATRRRCTDAVIWGSDAMRAVRATLEQVADTDVTILIQARAASARRSSRAPAHDLSPRRTSRSSR
jgi:two-component system C4-dicarboxylate transport response regulator DctD